MFWSHEFNIIHLEMEQHTNGYNKKKRKQY